jgi:hypothetical protein
MAQPIKNRIMKLTAVKFPSAKAERRKAKPTRATAPLFISLSLFVSTLEVSNVIRFRLRKTENGICVQY